MNGTEVHVTDRAVVNDINITGLTCDSRQVEPGFLFAALPGTRTDGRAYINDALERGAVAVLAPAGTTFSVSPRPVALLTDANPRRQFALMAANFFEVQPDVVAAVTGTNGKTSVVTFLRQIWSRLGRKAASAGTLGVSAPGFENRISLTTPDSADLHRNLRDLKRFGIERLALEASSHGLQQHRLDGVRVALAAFTNLTRDHLDYHRDMDAYLAAKLRLFTDIVAADGTAVVNADSDFAVAVAAACNKRRLKVMRYGRAGDAVRLMECKPLAAGQRITVALDGEPASVTLPLVGEFQVSNALCALALAIASDEDAKSALGCLETLTGAPGRVQLAGRHQNGAAVFVDYAHTPDALTNVLGALRPHAKGRLHVVFGCGGDRDPGKRPQMGDIARRLADVVIVTDDNPRGEDAAVIRRQILAACPDARDIGDRAEAIREAIKGLAAGDLLVVAGKGHERGQIVGNETHPFDDGRAVKDALREIGA
ncbi:MAG: UDP-N-acetylmuramoyl-L-alanyl-D-glutamate--2,6-diaminopimelate ligase [Rhodospirillales bacterium]|jgi:UDP-N-acetylmuramoyl-L-alanyl-D-glutamate--2,6-diaminopimelate ligase